VTNVFVRNKRGIPVPATFKIFSEVIVEVRADSRQNNRKAIVLQFKIGDFAIFREILSKINIFDTRVVRCHFVSFFVKKSFGD